MPNDLWEGIKLGLVLGFIAAIVLVSTLLVNR